MSMKWLLFSTKSLSTQCDGMRRLHVFIPVVSVYRKTLQVHEIVTK